jgi:transcriptional regulator with XRE-family HTH domain
MERHEGEELRNYLKGKGLEMQDVAEKLDMSRQNLNYHLRKQALDEDFKRLVKDKMQIDFPLGKSERKMRTTESEDYSLRITNPFEFLIQNAIKTGAQIEVILEMLAEFAARDHELSSSELVSEINKRVHKKILSLKDRLK